MKRSTAKFMQAAVAVLALVVFIFLLWEPHVEGRNAHATLFEIYFNDAFLACAYAASIPFFVAVYQAFKLFGDAGRDEIFSLRSLSALRTVKYCTLIVIGFVLMGEAYLLLAVRGKDDIAGGVAMGIFVILFSAIAATAAALFERNLQARVLTDPAP